MAAYEEKELVLLLTLGEDCIQIGGSDSPYRLLSSGIDGIESAEAALSFSENAQLDGAALLSCRVPGREITIRFEIADYDNRDRYRGELQSFFMPCAAGTLTVCRRGRADRKIGVSLNGRVTMTQETLYDYIRVCVPLYCPDPFFYAEAEPGIAAKGAEALLTVPLTVTSDTGVTAGEVVSADTMTVCNRGDMETGFLLCLHASEKVSGEGCRIVNPKVTIDSDGRYIRILETLAHDDTLTICTVPGAKYILKNGEKSMRFDRESSFFPLPVGISTLTFSADEQLGHLEAVLAWRTRHNGA